jgi:hypothetical protein
MIVTANMKGIHVREDQANETGHWAGVGLEHWSERCHWFGCDRGFPSVEHSQNKGGGRPAQVCSGLGGTQPSTRVPSSIQLLLSEAKGNVRVEGAEAAASTLPETAHPSGAHHTSSSHVSKIWLQEAGSLEAGLGDSGLVPSGHSWGFSAVALH